MSNSNTSISLLVEFNDFIKIVYEVLYLIIMGC